jgi:membrane-associated phospholipid phosphatase
MRLFLLRFVLTAILLNANGAAAQHSHDSVSYLKSYFTDTREIIRSPLQWDATDVGNLTMVAGATAFLALHDEKLNNFVSGNQSKVLKNISHFGIAPFGNGIYSLPLLGAVYLGGAIAGNNYDKQMALLGLKTWIIAAGEATVMKAAFQRQRPGDNDHPDAFAFNYPIRSINDNGSFVSRHATTAFALAVVFSEGYKSKKKWVPWVAYSLASLVAISRVYEQEHWVSDAFAGACLGYVTGKMLYKLNSRFLNNTNKNFPE